jgi:hypothetical protein
MSSSGTKSVDMQAAVIQKTYTCRLKEDKVRTIGGSNEDLSVRWCWVHEF